MANTCCFRPVIEPQRSQVGCRSRSHELGQRVAEGAHWQSLAGATSALPYLSCRAGP